MHAALASRLSISRKSQETLELVNTMTELAEEDQLTTNPAEAY